MTKKIVQRQLSPARIVDLRSKKSEDAYGDAVLYIRVVYESEQDHLDPRKVLGLSRHVRQPLRKSFEDIYPIFSLITPDEVESVEAR
ncbi:MAG: hypothetical protein OXC91_09985 [Rhodobacteraceae bacterium]|nr:hypothetical protein [Paracoccaceae bacterium]